MSGGKHSKAKGSAGELQVIRLIQPWWRQVEAEAVFRRTPGSGGWARSKGFKARGDVQADKETASLWRWSVEIKWRASITDAAIQHFQEGGDSPIWSFWRQSCEAAELDGLHPMLWFRGNRMPWRIVCHHLDGVRMWEESTFLQLDPRLFLKM